MAPAYVPARMSEFDPAFELKEGVLTIDLPKRPEAQAQKIPVTKGTTKS
jgi:HSP20 family molecular chaperone IbpA